MSKRVGVTCLLTVFLTLFSALQVLALDEAAICAAAGGDWSEWEYECVIFEEGQNPSAIDYRYEVIYPTAVAFEPFIVDAFDVLIKTTINMFMDGVDATPSSPGPLWLEMSYRDFHYNSDIFSVVFYDHQYTGGASTNRMPVHTFTFDRAGDRVLEVEDLFLSGVDPLDLIEPIVIADLQAQLGNDPATLAAIEAGTAHDINNYRNFAIDDDTLIFFFQPYQVAAGAAGGRAVRVPLSQIQSIWGLTSAATCEGSLPTRLAANDRGRIAQRFSTLRRQPAGAPIQIVYAPASFTVLQGPVCAGTGSLAWYEIEYDSGLRGWASESQVQSIWGENAYWLEPLP